MSWDRRIDLHIDVDAPSTRNLITSETDSSVLNSPPEFVAGDKLKVRLHFWRRGSVPGTVESIDPGATATFRISGRELGVPSASPLLFVSSSFTEVGTGIWETTLDLATQELSDHIAAAPEGAKTITCEVEVRDATDTARRSIQFLAKAMPQVWANQDAPTALPAPQDWLLGSTAPVNAAAWTSRDSSRDWYDVASSSDGTKLVAGVAPGQLYTSADSGATWTARETSRNWTRVASSANGAILVAANNSGGIYVSLDSGATWNLRSPGNQGWNAVAISSDGTKIVASGANGVFYSSDSGLNWVSRGSSRSDVAMSSDGTKLVACTINAQLYTSTDSGVTWTARETNRSWRKVAMSSDGTKMVAVADSSQIFTSTDGGVTWTARETSRAWRTITCSGDMQKLIASYISGTDRLVQYSEDGGITWRAVPAAPLLNWQKLALSSDGSKLVAAPLAANLYTVAMTNLITTPAPPYIRVAGGFLYIQEAGVWKKTALSAL